jgi:hypothetical protein
MDADNEIKNPILNTIFEINDNTVLSVKGNVGNDCAAALHEVYGKKIDEASGYILESMQQDNILKEAVALSIVDEKDRFNQLDKHYTLVYAVDPATITPVELIDFKTASNETSGSIDGKSDMILYLPDAPTGNVENKTAQFLNEIVKETDIKIIHGMESLVQHLRGA